MSWKEGELTLKAGETLAAKRRVKIDSSATTSDPPSIIYADAGEDMIGVTLYSAATDELVAVKPLGAEGSMEITAKVGSAITPGVSLYGAADGKISDTSSGSVQGVALQTAAASGDVIEVAPYSVKSTTAGTVSVADAGSYTAQTTVEAAVQEIYKHLLNSEGFIPIPLGSLKTSGTVFASGTSAVTSLLATDSTPKIGRINGATDPAQMVTWATGGADAVWYQTPLPPDFDGTGACYVKARVKANGATDTPSFTVSTYWDEGDTAIADTLAASSATSTWGEVSATIAAADVPDAPQILNIKVVPGAHTTNTFHISALWLEYKRKLLTA